MSRTSLIFIWLAFAAWLTILVAKSIPLPVAPGTDFWSLSASEILAQAGYSDYGSYIKYARILASGALNSPHEDAWVTNIWPPAFPLVIAFLLKTAGEASYGFKLGILTVLAWATVLTHFLKNVPFLRSTWARFLVLASVCALPEFRQWSFGTGILMTESLSMALFVLAGAFFYKGISGDGRKAYLIGTLFLGLSANFKALLDGVFGLLFLALLGGLAFVALLEHRIIPLWIEEAERPRFRARLPDRIPAMKTVFLCFLVLGATTAPWKMRNFLHNGPYAMSPLGLDLNWEYQWSPTDKLAGFVHAGNTACAVNPAPCPIIYENRHAWGPKVLRSLVLGSLMANPSAWIRYRLERVNWLWVGVPWPKNFEEAKRTFFLYVEGFAYIAAAAFGLWLLLKHWRARRARCLSTEDLERLGLLFALFFGIHAASFLIFHFESRYSLFWRTSCFLFLAFVAARRATQENERSVAT